MGNALSNSNVDKTNTKSLSQIIDYVATNYILTQNFKDMEKLTDTEYCNNLVILTSKIVDQKLSNLEISYLTQRLKGKSEINEMDSDKLIYFKKDAIDSFDVQNVQNATQKRRMCIGIAKFYVKIAQVFSAIVTTVNPTYKFKDISGNTQEVDLTKKENIPDEAKASIQRINMCSQRINALINGQSFNPNQKEPVKINPKFCEINSDSKTGNSRNLYSEPGMPELEKLYFDKYDYDHGGFVGMTEKMRKTVYEKDVEVLYKAFTGNDKIPLDAKGEKTIKTFTQIPLRNYKNSEGCSPGGKYTKAYEGSIKEKLFYEYASHINGMMNNVNNNQSKLLAIIDRLFSFNINPLTKKKEIVVKASLTEKKLEDIVVETRTIIQDLYKNCELDFLNGLKIYEDIINKTIKDTTLIQIKQLEEKRDVILTESDLDKIKEDKPAAKTENGPVTPDPLAKAEPSPTPEPLAKAEPVSKIGTAIPEPPKVNIEKLSSPDKTPKELTTAKPIVFQSPSPSLEPTPSPSLESSPSPSLNPLTSKSPTPSPVPLLSPLSATSMEKAIKKDIIGTPPPALPKIKITNEPEVFPVYLKEAGGDGNCFFNSIYDSANEEKLLEKIYNTYKAETNPVDKKTFVTYIRNLVAKKLAIDDEGLITTYELFELAGIKNKIKLEDDKKYIVEDFQPWLIDLYKNSKNFDDFKEKVINTIKNSSNYIQGIEYGITEDLLEDAGINIESHRFNNAEGKESDIKELNKVDTEDIPIIHLLNETYSKGHFKYFSFIKPAETAPKISPAAAQSAPAAPAAPAAQSAPAAPPAAQSAQSAPAAAPAAQSAPAPAAKQEPIKKEESIKENFLYRGLKNFVLFSGGNQNKTKRKQKKYNKNKKTKRRV